MSDYFKKYLKNIKFEKSFRKLKKKLKDKKIVIYGTGLLFQYINENFDLSELNILGVSDIKFSVEQDGEKYLGYNVIPKTLIPKYNPDYVVVASENYMTLMEELHLEFIEYDSIKFLPLAKKSMIEIIKIIWQMV